MRLFSLLALLLFSSTSFANNKICLSDHIFKSFKSYGKSLENAVQMAIDENNEKVIVEKHYFDKSPLAALKAYQEMVKSKCDGIIGFSYLSDLMTLSNSNSDISIPIFSPYGSTYSVKLQDKIKLLQPPQEKMAGAILNFLILKYKGQEITVITDLRRIEMQEYKKAFKKLSKETQFTVKYIDSIKDTIDKESIKSLTKIVITFTGTQIAAKLIKNTDDKKVFIGVETYGSKTSPSLLRLIGKNPKKEIFSFRNLSYVLADKKVTEFYNRYLKKYSKPPTILSVYGYDSAKILLSIFNNRKDEYDGLSGAKYKNGNTTPSNKYVIVSPSMNYELIKHGDFQ